MIPNISEGQQVVIKRHYNYNGNAPHTFEGVVDSVYGNWAVAITIPGFPGLMFVSQTNFVRYDYGRWIVEETL